MIGDVIRDAADNRADGKSNMADAIDRLGDGWLEEAGITPEPEAQEPEPVEAPEPKPEPEQAKAEPEQKAETAEPEEKFNPTLYREMKEERAKRQAMERELQALKSQQPQQPQQPAKLPDAYEDPQGFGDHFKAEIDRVRWETKAELSGFAAEQKHGKEAVEEAIAWAQAQAANDPTLELRVRNSASPVEFVVQEYQQSRTLQTIGGRSFDEAAKAYAIEQGWIVSPEADAPPSPKPSPPKPPRGLASTPGSGSAAPKDADWGEVKFALDK